MFYQRLRNVDVAALDQEKGAWMGAGPLQSIGDGSGYDLSSAGVGGVALDHDGAARCQRRGRVATGGGEGQREVRRAKHRDGAQRALHHAEVRPGQGRAVGQGGVVADVEEGVRPDVRGEEAELAAGAPALALEPRLREAGLLRTYGSDLGPARLDGVGDGLEQGGAVGAGA